MVGLYPITKSFNSTQYLFKDEPIVFLTPAFTKGEIDAGGGQLGWPFLAKPVVLSEMLPPLRHHLGDDEPHDKLGREEFAF